MNYHIMVQDKFIDSFIDDIYKINAEDNNDFWIRGNKNGTNHINTDKKVTYIGNDVSEWKIKLSKLSKKDSIFIHWYDMWIGELVLNLPNKLFVFHWGGDFFGEPLWHNAKWLFEKVTYRYVKRNSEYPYITFKRGKNLLLQLKNLINFKRNVIRKYNKKHEQIERIDYIILVGSNTGDVKKTKEIYPKFNAIHLSGFYNLNFNISNDKPIKDKRDEKIKLLLGNSATPSNNHLDAFKKLSKLKNIEIYCPLSYGDVKYRDLIIREGRQRFGKNFHPVLDFLRREEYVVFLNSMDIVYMYHNRSQAWGNIATCLTLGKPVFLRSTNSIGEMIDNIGIKKYDADKINKLNLATIMKDNQKRKSLNVKLLENVISDTVRLENLKQIMNIRG